MKKREIIDLKARHIFDSRGVPTIKCRAYLADGSMGEASVPSGASTGKYEAHELRDNEKGYGGKGVFNAIYNINNDILNLLKGQDASDISKIDMKMCELDNSKNKSNLGANAILAVSLACTRAVANSYSIPLYKYLGGINANILPVPFMNILNGGKHADNNLDIQEFMILPVGATSFAGAMRIASEVYASLKKILKEKSLQTAVGDEGGFAPDLSSDREALEYILKAIEKAGYKPGEDVCLALDVAASDWYEGGNYHLPKSGKKYTSEELEGHLLELCSLYPIVSVEDPLSEDDWQGFKRMTEKVGKIQIVGDDLFVTNPERLMKGINMGAANSVLIKPNQIGTLSQTLETIHLAKKHGYKAVISHRSGETEDTFIADLCVGVSSGAIKCGAPCRSERVCKYNRLLAIEDELGDRGRYGILK